MGHDKILQICKQKMSVNEIKTCLEVVLFFLLDNDLEKFLNVNTLSSLVFF